MASSLRFSGATGEIRCGYQVAARFGAWTYEHPSIEAQPGESSSFWLAQSPLDLYLDMGKVRWCWKGVELLEHGHIVRIRVDGKPEKR